MACRLGDLVVHLWEGAIALEPRPKLHSPYGCSARAVTPRSTAPRALARTLSYCVWLNICRNSSRDMYLRRHTRTAAFAISDRVAASAAAARGGARVCVEHLEAADPPHELLNLPGSQSRSALNRATRGHAFRQRRRRAAHLPNALHRKRRARRLRPARRVAVGADVHVHALGPARTITQ